MSLSSFTDRSTFEHLIQSLIADGENGSFGRLHVVSIKPLLDQDDWQRLMPKVTAIAEHILHQRLGPTDTCLPLAPGQYLLLFPSLSEGESRVRAASIAREIRHHLSGTASQHLEVAAEVMPLSILRQAHTPPTLDSMRTTLEAGHPPSGIRVAVDHQPVWHLQREAVVGSRARARRDFGEQVRYENAVLFGGEDDPLATTVNTHLAQAGAAFPADHGLLFLPLVLNRHTLAAPLGIMPFLDTLRHGNNANLVVELVGSVARLSRPTLRAAISAIRSRRLRVAIRMVPDRETAKFIRDCGAEFLCLNQMQAHQADFTPSAIYALYTLVSRDLGDLGFHLCLWNADRAEDIKRAAAQGFTLFSGTPVGASAAAAAPLKPLTAAHMFA